MLDHEYCKETVLIKHVQEYEKRQSIGKASLNVFLWKVIQTVALKYIKQYVKLFGTDFDRKHDRYQNDILSMSIVLRRPATLCHCFLDRGY